MALPQNITPKTVTFGPAVHFDGTVAEGTVTITAPENVVNTTTNAPLYSSQMSKRLVDGMASFSLCPTDADGLNIKSWTYKITTVISGALKQDDARWFVLPTAGPDEIDLDSLVTVPSSAGIPVSVAVLTADSLPGYIEDYFDANPVGGAVDSVNGETGVVVLTAAEVGAQPAGSYATTQALTDGLAAKADALVAQNQKTGTAYTLALVDAGTVVEATNSSPVTVTVPLASAVNFPVGSTVVVRQYGAGQVTIAGTSGVTLRSRGSALKLAGQYAEAAITKRSADEWVVSGDVTA